jgi:tRNA(adenine34) deaminase
MRHDHEYFMRIALEEAALAKEKANMAVGAVIARDSEVLSRAHNEVGSTLDVTAHAETAAVRKLTLATRQLNTGSQADSGPLAGCRLYTTVEPCPMCCWVTCIAGLSWIVMGARHAELGISFGAYTVEKLIELSGRRIKLITGILSVECAEMCRSGPFTAGPR